MPREAKLENPSPHPTDVPEDSGGGEGRALGRPPSPDASGIELIESSTVSRNPLVGETRVSEPEVEETKEDSNTHGEDNYADARDVENLPPEVGQEQPPSFTSPEISAREGPILVTKCHTVYSVLTFAISSIYPLIFTYINLFDSSNKVILSQDFWTGTLLPTYAFATMISFLLKVRLFDLYKIFHI